MSAASTQSRRTATARAVTLPLQDLTLQETLRVMDVAREIRDQRETAEEMFRRDDLRHQLREKLLQTARMSGEQVGPDEIDAAIEQYMQRLHTYQDPPLGWDSLIAHAWVWRSQIMATLIAATAAGGTFWLLFG